MKVLVSDPVAREGVELLKTQVEVDVKTGLKPEELKAIIGQYDGLVVRSETQVTPDIIEAGNRLQVIARAGVGLDNINIEAATRRGVVVVNAPTGNTIAATEHTMALMLALARHLPQADSKLKAGEWKRSAFVGNELKGKTLGIIGLGNIGAEVARRAKAFEMNLIGYDPYVSSDFAQNMGVRVVPLEQLYKEADFITLHIPLVPATKGMISAKELATMKPTARIINCARGGLIDEQALYDAVEQGKIAGAAVDVFSKEPAVDNVLTKSAKIIVTPHLGASTAEAQVGVAVDAAEQVLAVLRGQPARYAVNTPHIARELLTLLGPFMPVASSLGSLAGQVMEGQIQTLNIRFCGEISGHDVTALKTAVISGLLQQTSEERITMVNASSIAARRGLKVIEQKETSCENYNNLIEIILVTDKGTYIAAGTVMRGATHIVRVNNYWVDVVPTGGYFLFCDHKDRPGLIGAVGDITGAVDINISHMQVARLEARGPALMVLALDDNLPEEARKKVLGLKDVFSAKVVKL
jgi:D-3-phosphoglycerate dehydrogenase